MNKKPEQWPGDRLLATRASAGPTRPEVRVDLTMTSKAIGGRYLLHECIGVGGHGAVWRASDRIAGEWVAVKLIETDYGARAACVRWEVAALRLLRVPGVVRLLDEGRHEGVNFLVMELVHGVPFPGANLPQRWEEIRPATISLLEVVARIHAMGVVHRDLKPANVLVDREGRVTVLDFGVAWGSLDVGITERGQIVGTPRYLAPEQANAGPIGPRADLYALGAMLYEALSGRTPHEGEDFEALMLARQQHAVVSLRTLCPELPGDVADVVDAMLARAPEDRPRSAAEVLAMLKGQPKPKAHVVRRSRIIDAPTVDRLVAAARAGSSLDIAGPPGSGRTRCLEAAAHTLQAEGRTVRWTVPSRFPFMSLAKVLGYLEIALPGAPDDVAIEVGQRLSALLAAGDVIVVDDPERMDAWTIAALAECRKGGSILRALDTRRAVPRGAVQIRPIGHDALQELFAGPDRILHLADDAAAALLQRTEGWPPRIDEEIDAWVRAGIARRVGERLVVTRESLDRLDMGLRIAPIVREAGEMTSTEEMHTVLPSHLRELAAWLALAWPHTECEVLASVMKRPREQIDAGLSELVDLGFARRVPEGRTELVRVSTAEPHWPTHTRHRAHRALAAALAPGAERRLHHLLAASEGGDVTHAELVDEAITLARAKDMVGLVGHGVAVLDEVLRTLRRDDRTQPDPRLEERLLAVWTDLALTDGTSRGMDRVLYEICRAHARTPTIEGLESLVRAALAARVDGERTLATMGAITTFDDPDLAWWWHGVRVQAARRCTLAREEEVLGQATTWAERSTDPMVEASLSGWLGRLRYRQLRFAEAAALHTHAAERERRLTRRIVAMNNAASALMDALRLDAAEAMARDALVLARRCRHPYLEGRAEWVLRSIRYRRGEALQVDHDLVEAIGALDHQDLEALICMTEAAVAWRGGEIATAAMFSTTMLQSWSASGWIWPSVLPRCFVLEHTRMVDPSELHELARQVITCPVPDVAIQALGLLARLLPSGRAQWQGPMDSLAARFDPADWGHRREVLSIHEAMALMQGDSVPGLPQIGWAASA